MSIFYGRLANNPKDLTPIIEAVVYFENEINDAKKEVKIYGSIEKASSDLPGIVEHRFGQYQEVEAILKFLEIKHTKIKGEAFKKYLEGYNKALSSRDAEKYADADDSVIDIMMLINHMALIRNEYMGIIKGLDVKQWQLTNLIKLKVAGMEDYEI